MRVLPSNIGFVFLLSALLSVAGCAGNAVSDETVESQSAALTSVDYYDSTGLVHIQVKTCDWTAAAEHNVTACTVNPGFVLVGGGAEVENSASGGGLLTKSFPANNTTWFAASKDHVVAYAHRLRAYAVGMALQNMTSTALSSLVTITSATSSAGHAPSVQVNAPNFNVVLSWRRRFQRLGGGAIAHRLIPFERSPLLDR